MKGVIVAVFEAARLTVSETETETMPDVSHDRGAPLFFQHYPSIRELKTLSQRLI